MRVDTLIWRLRLSRPSSPLPTLALACLCPPRLPPADTPGSGAVTRGCAAEQLAPGLLLCPAAGPGVGPGSVCCCSPRLRTLLVGSPPWAHSSPLRVLHCWGCGAWLALTPGHRAPAGYARESWTSRPSSPRSCQSRGSWPLWGLGPALGGSHLWALPSGCRCTSLLGLSTTAGWGLGRDRIPGSRIRTGCSGGEAGVRVRRTSALLWHAHWPLSTAPGKEAVSGQEPLAAFLLP